ncbi:MAG TPA: hypothetical protein VKZ53_07105 [Candidatus Angelobacter sp.]|nr:hypothetical protein [Candidatus Angelobacter sp.]
MKADQLELRIRRITEDLKAVQAGLSQLGNESCMEQEKHRLIETLLGPSMLIDLKAAVDNMRQFLWDYLEAAAQASGEHADYAFQAYRLQRVTQMLRCLRQQNGNAENSHLPEDHSLFEEIQIIADHAVEKHEGE